jgi:aminoglycoside/choline kinase family phosphotransferase
LSARDVLVADALDASAWAEWTRNALAVDASRRRYLRLTSPDGQQSVIVMDAPPDSGEDVRPFMRIAAHLAAAGLCPPGVLWADPETGLLVLEDLGPTHFAEWLTLRPHDETMLYSAASDVLIRLHRTAPPSGLTVLDPDTAATMTDLACEWFGSGPQTRAAQALHDAVGNAMAAHADGPMVIALRDFHAENLIWRDGRAGTDRVGLLDFQDAFLAHPAYDLASLLRDPRRDVSLPLADKIIAGFVAESGADDAAFRAAFACVAAQRNLRILGIFARLIRRDGKPRYAAFMPRVWSYLQEDLRHPALADLRRAVVHALPEPDRIVAT